MVGKLAPNPTHFIRGLVKKVPGRGYFKGVPSQNGDKCVTSPPPPIVERVFPPDIFYIKWIIPDKARDRNNSENVAARVDAIAHSLLFTSNLGHPSNITPLLSPCLMCFLTSLSPSKFFSSWESANAPSRTFSDAATEPKESPSPSTFEVATSSTGRPCVAFYDGDTQDAESTLDFPSHTYVVQYAYVTPPQ